jgi:hypothetical protein
VIKFRLTFAVADLVAEYGTLFNMSITVEQLANVIFSLLLVQHPDKQLSVVCKRTERNDSKAGTLRARRRRNKLLLIYCAAIVGC